MALVLLSVPPSGLFMAKMHVLDAAGKRIIGVGGASEFPIGGGNARCDRTCGGRSEVWDARKLMRPLEGQFVAGLGRSCGLSNGDARCHDLTIAAPSSTGCSRAGVLHFDERSPESFRRTVCTCFATPCSLRPSGRKLVHQGPHRVGNLSRQWLHFFPQVQS